MSTCQLVYRRAILKISGNGFGESGINLAEVRSIANQIKRVNDLGAELAIVVGGGNLVRGAQFSQYGIHRATADQMGMLSTVINALALQDILEQMGAETRLQTAIEMRDVAEPYIRRRCIRHLEKGRIVILAAGTGHPIFTTDSAAALRAVEISAEVLLKATRVDGVYSSDPLRDPAAQRYSHLSYLDVLNRQLNVMDTTAISLCMDNRIPIVVFNLKKEGNIERVFRGEPIGTIIEASPPDSARQSPSTA